MQFGSQFGLSGMTALKHGKSKKKTDSVSSQNLTVVAKDAILKKLTPDKDLINVLSL